MREQISVFYSKKIPKMSEYGQIQQYYESYFLSDKLKTGIPPWDEYKGIVGREPDGVSKRAYAMAILCRKHLYGIEDPLPHELDTYRPFDVEGKQNMTPSMNELMDWPGTLALFPTCTGEDASCVMMFLFRPREISSYEDNRHLLCGNKIISDKILVYLLKGFAPMNESLSRLNGDSWQLAYVLAERALKNDSGQGANKQKLLNWLITGALDPMKETVKPVEIGAKPKLLVAYSNVLKLLVPQANEEELEQGVQFQVADSVDQAWRIVTGTGFETGTIHLPDPIKELHVLVGESIQPLLFAIFRLAPQKTILWHSDETVHEARIIRDLFTELRRRGYRDDNDTGEIDLLETTSNDMQACYDAISSAINKNGDRNSIVINTTGGNRLMGFAALLVAKDLNVTVIYRDREHQEEKKHMVTGIRFDNGKNLNCIIPLDNRWRGKEINWDKLCDYNRDFPQNVEDIRRLIFS